jgi:predicted RecB family endonuclease
MSAGERSSIDDIVEIYKRDVDRTLIRQRLTRSIEERLEDLMELQRFAEELRRAGRRASRRISRTSGEGRPGCRFAGTSPPSSAG